MWTRWFKKTLHWVFPHSRFPICTIPAACATCIANSGRLCPAATRCLRWLATPSGFLRSIAAEVVDRYFNPSCLPAESSAIDSRIRRSRVSGRLAVWIQTTKSRRFLAESVWKNAQALLWASKALRT